MSCIALTRTERRQGFCTLKSPETKHDVHARGSLDGMVRISEGGLNSQTERGSCRFLVHSFSFSLGANGYTDRSPCQPTFSIVRLAIILAFFVCGHRHPSNSRSVSAFAICQAPCPFDSTQVGTFV